MKKIALIAAAAILIFGSASNLTAGGPKGKAEDFHHAMYLCYQHTADHAKALFDQAATGEFNLDIAKDFVSQIGGDLDHARVYHAMVHKTYTEADLKTIEQDHLASLNGQTKAAAALASLKEELEKGKPDTNVIKTLAASMYEGAEKAANAHMDAMKKLGVPEAKGPGA